MRAMYGIQKQPEEETGTRFPLIEQKKTDSGGSLNSFPDSRDSTRTITPLPPISPHITKKDTSNTRSTPKSTVKPRSATRPTDLNKTEVISNRPPIKLQTTFKEDISEVISTRSPAKLSNSLKQHTSELLSTRPPIQLQTSFKEDRPAVSIIQNLNHTQNLQHLFKASYTTSLHSASITPQSPNLPPKSSSKSSEVSTSVIPIISFSVPDSSDSLKDSNSYAKYSSIPTEHDLHEEVEEEMDEVKGLLAWVQELPDEMSSDMSGTFINNGIVI